MGEDLTQDGRNSVRSPMQWSSGRNGGFSTAPKAKLAQSVIDDGPFGHKHVNVEAQVDDPESLLSFVKKLGKERRALSAIGEQDCRMIETGSKSVLAHGFRAPDCELVMIHNLSGRHVPVEVERDAAMSQPPIVLVGGEVDASDAQRLKVELEPYGARWLKWPR
jgi:maltose alpha-D-glucosyltransferase/alpha-amylase